MGNVGGKYICNFTRLFNCAIVDFEVADGSRFSFPTDASNHLPDLFHGSLASHSKDMGSLAISFVLPNDSASFRAESCGMWDPCVEHI